MSTFHKILGIRPPTVLTNNSTYDKVSGICHSITGTRCQDYDTNDRRKGFVNYDIGPTGLGQIRNQERDGLLCLREA